MHRASTSRLNMWSAVLLTGPVNGPTARLRYHMAASLFINDITVRLGSCVLILMSVLNAVAFKVVKRCALKAQ